LIEIIQKIKFKTFKNIKNFKKRNIPDSR